MDYLENNSWTFLPLTTSKFDSASFEKYSILKPYLNSHRVIGQEFDNVAIILDSSFEMRNKTFIIKEEIIIMIQYKWYFKTSQELEENLNLLL